METLTDPLRKLVRLGMTAGIVFGAFAVHAELNAHSAAHEAKAARTTLEHYNNKYNALNAKGHVDLQSKDIVLGPGEDHLSEVSQTSNHEQHNRNVFLVASGAEFAIVGTAMFLNRRREVASPISRI
ncbi:MAG TPA: hypothetical protein VLF90_04445 [Patescibacteria group bacterium]|nr:hypothetical protein [Patescibacteria group bacterium]